VTLRSSELKLKLNDKKNEIIINGEKYLVAEK